MTLIATIFTTGSRGSWYCVIYNQIARYRLSHLQRVSGHDTGAILHDNLLHFLQILQFVGYINKFIEVVHLMRYASAILIVELDDLNLITQIY